MEDNDNGTGQEVANKKTPIKKAMIQHTATNVISSQFQDLYQNPTGREVMELISPRTPATARMPIKLTQKYPQSAFWMNQMGKSATLEDKHEGDLRTQLRN